MLVFFHSPDDTVEIGPELPDVVEFRNALEDEVSFTLLADLQHFAVAAVDENSVLTAN